MAKLIAGFLTGFAFAVTIYWSPRLTRGIWTSNPPQDPDDYTGPRYRYWIEGVEQ